MQRPAATHRFRLHAALGIALAGLLHLGPLLAQNPSPAPHPAPQPGTVAFAGKITALQPEAHTLIVEDPLQGPRTVHISDQTRLQKNARPAAWPDLKVGQSVEGTGRGHGTMLHADSLQIGE